MKAALCALALSGLASALPAIQQRNANFDDLNAGTGVTSLTPVPDPYMGLEFDGFNVINVGNAATGVKPQSGDQVGVQYILTTGVDNTATLKTAGNTKYFALQEFYFGCVLSSQETLAGVPTSCALTLTGKRNGKTVATQDVNFGSGLVNSLTSGDLLTKDMKRVRFDGRFQAVDEVSFELTSTLAAATSVLYDNVRYVTYSS
ncbi:hypothetical protein KC343_g9675 [Hortaea werneckii]|uniref:Ubiquitin 3 binding protein But2 C-terminal domain-containing protein n=1 Tax=Hortaea werneckii TaxID=91943 RepID=A0A3M7CCH8_HORWE|nr:hypothetical protein KC352_g27390 [Hortaea werneckii]KAI7560762.1 hypothetical protein KC317_g9520 [Hortaea werneckii]KAI7609446.1 hypothetical protein KC346_g9189 [Hortaea werneckii]KAI7616725.1 hypothetical protein KC343_g9675 [Hortaea werneckii]KAI7659159.1 hypothetical protein KC319_g9039 [Hortaea werneckii]